jgi:hypothetical protein
MNRGESERYVEGKNPASFSLDSIIEVGGDKIFRHFFRVDRNPGG